MGARQRAQNRVKSKKGSEKGSPWSQKKSSSSLQGNSQRIQRAPFLIQIVTNLDPSLRPAALQGWHQFARSESASAQGSGYGTPRNGFSMMQEARNTDRHVSGWGPTKLRGNGIAFVSAGTLTREEPPVPIAQESSSSEQGDEDGPEETVDREDSPVENGTVQSTAEISRATASIQITDLPTAPEPEIDDLNASSEEDEVIFTGRQVSKVKGRSELPSVFEASRLQKPPLASDKGSRAASPRGRPGNLPSSSRDKDEIGQMNPLPALPTSHPEIPSASQWAQSSSELENVSAQRRPVNHRYRKGWRARKTAVDSEEDAILQDYIENMAKDEDEDDHEIETGTKSHQRNEHVRYNDGAAATHVKVQTTSVNRNAKDPAQAIDWSSADLEDFDDMSTTDEEIANVGQVLRHRERDSGAQYLVTAVGVTASDAKWISQAKLTSTSAVEEIRIYEEIRNMHVDVEDEESDSESVSTSEQEALDDVNENIESEMEENTRIFEHTQRMTDEEIALAIAKQEELGMGGDELMLFDGQNADTPDNDDEFANGTGFIPFSLSQHTSNRKRTKQNRRQRDSFPSAAAFADALDQDPYGAFDVMDFDRPSLRRTKGRARKSFPYELDLEDEDLEQQLVSTWMKDRDKKAARKREKMELRSAELLDAGARSDPAVIRVEIRQFLCDEAAIDLRLASMPPDLRAGVHRLAKSLKLISRSEGKEGVGAGRFPVLTKSAHTPYYDRTTIHEIDALLNLRKFFPKRSGGAYKGSRATKVPGPSKKGGTSFAAASYANGEVVGAAAPELGAENRGRAMLEKMGWSSGKGIGKEGNEGGLEHVKHVVKNNKAGLG